MERTYTYLELIERIRDLEVGTKFQRYNYGDKTHHILEVVEVEHKDGVKDKVFRWESGSLVIYNPIAYQRFTFEEVNPYTEIEISEAMELLRSGIGGVVYTEDCDGDIVAIDLDDDLSYDYDIDSFSDLVNLTKFYVK